MQLQLFGAFCQKQPTAPLVRVGGNDKDRGLLLLSLSTTSRVLKWVEHVSKEFVKQRYDTPSNLEIVVFLLKSCWNLEIFEKTTVRLSDVRFFSIGLVLWGTVAL